MSIFMFSLAQDLDGGIKSGRYSDAEVLEMIDSQRRVTLKFNRVFGLVLSVYSLYSTPFYSIHVIDMFNLPGFMNYYSIIIYLLYLGYFLYACLKINIMAKERKIWLQEKKRFMRIPRQKLALFLDEIIAERFGIGSLFVINNTLTGEAI
ncbi:unnamed protein product [Allacma fusca]|uniref:Uncharacterized protein n=1 Tax=Allacma fusca TaxID=39272 RepID=A0A8J2L9Q4_9HEXA|nr:unnamed protein product [Allacma fusca]